MRAHYQATVGRYSPQCHGKRYRGCTSIAFACIILSLDMDADKEWIENLICTVQNRPALYNKSLKEYADRNEKTKLWNEVCEVMIPNWSDCTPEERTIKGKKMSR